MQTTDEYEPVENGDHDHVTGPAFLRDRHENSDNRAAAGEAACVSRNL